MTGNTAQIAELVKHRFEETGVEVDLNECTEVEASDFENADVCVIATYTYGEGELPDEISDFYDDLTELDLTDKIYGVIGSGDKAYEDLFCAAVDKFEEAFENAGASKGAASVKIEFSPEEEDELRINEFVDQLIESI
jgi:flavodoxin short chain